MEKKKKIDQLSEALPLEALKYFGNFYNQFLKLFKDDKEKAAHKAVDKVVRMLKIKSYDRNDLLDRIKDKFDIEIKPSKLVGVSEKIYKLRVKRLIEKIDWGDSFEEIADKSGLTGVSKDRFVAYMTKRWGDREGKDPGYHAEWAERFVKGWEWELADSEGRKILKEVDPEYYGRKS